MQLVKKTRGRDIFMTLVSGTLDDLLQRCSEVISTCDEASLALILHLGNTRVSLMQEVSIRVHASFVEMGRYDNSIFIFFESKGPRHLEFS